jgi:hypothetical protein
VQVIEIKKGALYEEVVDYAGWKYSYFTRLRYRWERYTYRTEKGGKYIEPRIT